MSEKNPNLVWTELFVRELALCGLRHVCVAPGSRNTPLVLAFYAHPEITIHSHLDERSAAFFGLGMALATNRPIAVLCTSGTAGANFYPAIIESNMSQVPLLVLTADRPHELRHSGANQTIDQIKMYGDHVLWSVDAALPEKDPPEVALRNIRVLAARAMAAVDSLRKGPVHINFPFRKPFEPSEGENWLAQPLSTPCTENRPFTKIERGSLQHSPAQLTELVDLVSNHVEGLIVCGPRSPGGTFPQAVAELAHLCGYPLLADPLSGLRFGQHVTSAPIIGGYETFLQAPEQWPKPRLILYFGAESTSKRLNTYLAGCGSALHIHIRENGVWADEHHRTTHFLRVNEETLSRAVADVLSRPRRSAWLDRWLHAETLCWSEMSQAIEELAFDGAYVAALLDQLPEDNNLLVGNSLPVRHVNQFSRPLPKAIRIFGNRGASGIDGNISTGLGIAAGNGKPTTILTGDITFYHDNNGLLALRELRSNGVTIAVLNNDGGGIFQRLPVSKLEPPFRELFQTPHGLDLSSYAQTYGLEYHNPSTVTDLRSLLRLQSPQAQPRLIEIKTNATQDNKIRIEVESRVLRKLHAE